jgi:hypothetical protein
LWLAQRIIKGTERGEYMKKEPRKCLKLFLRLGKHCIEVSRGRRRRNEKRKKKKIHTRNGG